jgi:hypothetical protein
MPQLLVPNPTSLPPLYGYAASLQMEWELVIQDFRYMRRKMA